MNKILLVDGHSILNRAFYGLPDLTNAEGLHTGAVYGFLHILLKILDEEAPTHLAVAFDLSEPTFRHKMYDAYKGTRKPMQEELREQVPLIKETLDAMGILRCEQAGFEADDILGTLAKTAERDGMEVRLLSGDRDLLQIASDKICILLPRTKGGQTTLERWYAADVEQEYGVTPEGFIELKALMGDTSDNIPGVPKVGEKTAKELMARFQSIEGIYSHLDEITKNAVRTSLAENRDLCDLSKRLATICTDAPLAVTPAQAVRGELFTPAAYALFKRLGFKQLLNRFSETGTVPETEAQEAFETKVVTGEEEARACFAALREGSGCAGYHVVTDEAAGPVGLALYADGQDACYLPLQGTDAVSRALIREEMEALSAREDGMLCGADCKESFALFTPAQMRDNAPDAVVDRFFDVVIAAYLLNPLKNDYTVEDVSMEFLARPVQTAKERFQKTPFALVPVKEMADYAATCARIAAKAAPLLKERLREQEMLTLLETVEAPLSFLLYEMERVGVIAKRDALQTYGDQLTGRIDELSDAIFRAAGEPFNIQSPKQLGEILFHKLGMPGGKKTKTGYSTAADVLEKLAPDYPIVKDILEYRGLTKLKSTYAEGLQTCIAEDGRIHTVFHQTITATGRISSTEPNLQNIPMRTEQGRLIRKVFVPEEGCVFVDADYSQIELRILAHMSEDPGLIAAYHEGRDIHRITASKVFHTPFEEVTELQRRNAKAVNFGIVYGISSFGLAGDLSISRQEAAGYMEQYFATYPGVKRYQAEAIAKAKQKGYARTLYGRRRPMPELSSGNFMTRSFGERVAMNAPIQGTAADIIKIAMLKVFRRLRREGLKSRLILQIHDELLIEAPRDEQARVEAILTQEMEQAVSLSVPLTVDCHTGNDWYEAK